MRFVDIHQPATASLIALILPHRTNVLLEQRIVVAVLQIRCHANVIVQTPKVLDRIEAGDLVLHVLPGLGTVHLQVPQSPLVLKRMLDQTLLRDLLLGRGKGCVADLLIDDNALIGLGRVLMSELEEKYYSLFMHILKHIFYLHNSPVCKP